MKRLTHPSDLQSWKKHLLSERPAYQKIVAVSSGTCGQASGSLQIIDALREELEKRNLHDKVGMEITGCHGFCELEPNLVIYPQGIFYKNLETKDIPKIVRETLEKNRIVSSLIFEDPKSGRKYSLQKDIPFYQKQMRLLTEGNFKINPTRIEDYILAGGYEAVARALFDMTAEEVIQEVTASGLREKGGAGFPMGKKWQACRDEIADRKYVICNADEGEAGASIDSSLLEANPHSVIEGLIIGAYAIGAAEAYVCVRKEYPLAVRHLTLALEQAQRCGLLGRSILGSEFHLDIHILLGAGAFISREGSLLKPPVEDPSSLAGAPPCPTPPLSLWRKRTSIDNAETWANVTLIISRGADWYSKIGTAKSKGTKIFSLAGKISNAGLVEVPMGIRLKEIIFDIGGGIRDGKKFKAVQTGGPSGGFIPAQMLDLVIDHDALARAGVVIGSSGMVVLDETNCVVDMARYFLHFILQESRGKCAACRAGTKKMQEILTCITQGQGEEKDLIELESLANSVKSGCLCGFGQTAANPVLTTLKHFHHEYQAHVLEKSCPAYVCKELLAHYIEPEKCIGCLLCLENCPAGAIRGARKKAHLIDQKKCVKCGTCFEICPPKIKAVSKYTGKKRNKVVNNENRARVERERKG